MSNNSLSIILILWCDSLSYFIDVYSAIVEKLMEDTK